MISRLAKSMYKNIMRGKENLKGNVEHMILKKKIPKKIFNHLTSKLKTS